MSATRIHIDGIALIISLLFASLLVLLGTSFYTLNEDIELQLITDVRERLEEVGYQVSIDFDGRDATIGGNASDEKTIQEIIDITKNVEGVRTITNELTVAAIAASPEKQIDNNLEMGLSGITDNTAQNVSSVESIDDLVSSSAPNNTASKNSDINNYIATEDNSPPQKNFTEITEQPIVEENSVYYEKDETNLSAKHIASLALIVPLLTADTSLYVELSSFYKDPAIAIKRTDIIKEFFEKKGIDKKHFEVLWNDSPNENQVKLKLFHRK